MAPTPSPDRAARPRPPRRPRLAGALGGATVALLLLTACSGGGAGEGPKAPPPVPVTVGEVAREAVPVLVSAIGTVEARSTVSLRPQVGGVVTAVHFREGDDVERGQVLASIDPRSYRAALAEAEAQLARDRVRAANAHQNVERYADLVKKDYVTQEQYDQIVADAEAYDASVTADEAAVAGARLDLERATLRAPFAGRTGQVLIHAGNLVKANDDDPLVVIQQIEPIDVRFAVPQRYLGEIRARRADGGDAAGGAGGSGGGLTVEVFPAGGEPHTGALSFIDNAVDATTGTIALKASFANRDRALWPGQFVNVALTLSTQDDAVVAPAPAVQSGQQGDYVFVVKADDTVESRPVKVDRTVGEKAVIASGLVGGERVVTDGQLRLVPGARIEVKAEVNEAGAAPAAAPAAAAEAGR